jgi:hypothetical protein
MTGLCITVQVTQGDNYIPRVSETLWERVLWKIRLKTGLENGLVNGGK